MNIKKDKYDTTFSQFIKARDRFCQRCGKGDGKLECSHIFSRRHKGLRWDESNAKLLCFNCHRWWNENPPEATEWLKSVIGERAYDMLRIRANQVTKMSKFDMDLIRKDLQARIKAMEETPEPCWNPQFRQ